MVEEERCEEEGRVSWVGEEGGEEGDKGRGREGGREGEEGGGDMATAAATAVIAAAVVAVAAQRSRECQSGLGRGGGYLDCKRTSKKCSPDLRYELFVSITKTDYTSLVNCQKAVVQSIDSI